MTTAARRTALAGTLFAVTLTVLPARSETRDRPEVDTRRTECAINLNSEFIQQLPTAGRAIAQLSNTLPQQITARFERDSRGRTNDVTIDGLRLDGQGFRWDFDKVRLNERACRVEAQIPRAEFGSGYSGKVELTYHGPSGTANERLYLRGYNIRSPGGPIRGDQLWFFKPVAGAQGTPGTPDVPGAGGDTPGFTGWQPRVGLTIRDGGLFSGSFKPRQHSRDECDKHTVNGVSLCVVLGSGNTTVQVFNGTTSGFGYRSLGGPIPNLSFGDGYCNPDRCETQGSFFDQPVRKTLDGWRASGTDLLADTSVFFNEGRPNQSLIRFDYRGRYSPPGSTETILPPVVPNVPPPPPPPPGGFVLYAGGPTLTEGTRLNFEMSVLPHNTHEAHAVDWQGQRFYLCQKGVGVSEAVIRNIRAPNMFDLVRTAPPRPGFQWSTFNCERGGLGAPIACNGRGSFYGQDVLARGTTLIQPGSTSAEGTMDVEFAQTKSIVPFGIKYSF